jgi:hypothetical protein
MYKKKTEIQKEFQKFYKRNFPWLYTGGFAIDSLGKYRNNEIQRYFTFYQAGFEKAKENTVG